MEQSITNLSPEILSRRTRAEELMQDAKDGKITDLESLDPRETSIEVVLTIRGIMRQKGLLPRKNHQPEV